MTSRFYLLRHAEAATPHLFHGAESDIHLSDRGHEQARAVAASLRGLGPATLVSSPMLRARQTAAAIAEACDLVPHIEPDLHERKVGALQGTPNRPETGLWPDTLARWIAGDTHHAPDHSESWDQVQQRALRALDRLAHASHPGPIALVAHGLLMKIALLTIMGEGPAGWATFGPIRNTEIFTVEHSAAGWRLIAKPQPVTGGGP